MPLTEENSVPPTEVQPKPAMVWKPCPRCSYTSLLNFPSQRASLAGEKGRRKSVSFGVKQIREIEGKEEHAKVLREYVEGLSRSRSDAETTDSSMDSSADASMLTHQIVVETIEILDESEMVSPPRNAPMPRARQASILDGADMDLCSSPGVPALGQEAVDEPEVQHVPSKRKADDIAEELPPAKRQSLEQSEFDQFTPVADPSPLNSSGQDMDLTQNVSLLLMAHPPAVPSEIPESISEAMPDRRHTIYGGGDDDMQLTASLASVIASSVWPTPAVAIAATEVIALSNPPIDDSMFDALDTSLPSDLTADLKSTVIRLQTNRIQSQFAESAYSNSPQHESMSKELSTQQYDDSGDMEFTSVYSRSLLPTEAPMQPQAQAVAVPPPSSGRRKQSEPTFELGSPKFRSSLASRPSPAPSSASALDSSDMQQTQSLGAMLQFIRQPLIQPRKSLLHEESMVLDSPTAPPQYPTSVVDLSRDDECSPAEMGPSTVIQTDGAEVSIPIPAGAVTPGKVLSGSMGSLSLSISPYSPDSRQSAVTTAMPSETPAPPVYPATPASVPRSASRRRSSLLTDADKLLLSPTMQSLASNIAHRLSLQAQTESPLQPLPSQPMWDEDAIESGAASTTAAPLSEEEPQLPTNDIDSETAWARFIDALQLDLHEICPSARPDRVIELLRHQISHPLVHAVCDSEIDAMLTDASCVLISLCSDAQYALTDSMQSLPKSQIVQSVMNASPQSLVGVFALSPLKI